MAKTDSKTASNVVDIAQTRAARIRHARLARHIRRDSIRKAARAAL
jgi:hypothetical protein